MSERIEVAPKDVFCPVCSGKKIGTYCRYKNFYIHKCHDCKMLFRNVISKKPYEWRFDKTYCAENLNLSERQALANNTVKRIGKCVNRNLAGLNVLEIGVGAGVLGAAIVREGAYYEGVEPSAYFFKKAQDTFPTLGGKIQNCYFEDARLKENYYDLVVMIDTLEHVSCPLVLLRGVKKMLVHGGLLYLEVPSEDLLVIKAIIRRKVGLYGGYPSHIDHVNFFTKLTLRKIADKAGFEFIDIKEALLLGDYHKMRILMPSIHELSLKFLCRVFGIMKIDTIFKTGNLCASLK